MLTSIYRSGAQIFAFMALAAVCTGCGTVGGRRQIISLDSDPRGLTIVAPTADGPKKVTTPAFIEVQRAFRLNFADASDGLESQKLTCGFRWLESVLPDALFGLFSPVAALGGALIDFGTGAIFRCPAQILLRPSPEANRERRTYCRTYLVVPPHHFDEETSMAMTKAWRDDAKPRLKPCDRILSARESAQTFDPFNINHESEIEFRDLKRDLLNQIGFTTGATHLVFIEAGGDRRAKDEVQTTTFDIHTARREESRELTLSPDLKTRLDRADKNYWFLYSLNLLPNSVAYGTSLRDVEPTMQSGDDQITRQRPLDTLPRFVGNLSFTSVDHPAGFGTWDLLFRASPAVRFTADDVDYQIETTSRVPPPAGGDPSAGSLTSTDRHYRLTTYYAMGSYTFGLDVHTPMGAFHAGAGGGPAIIYYKDSEGYRRTTVTGFFVQEFSYTAFVTQSVFLQAQSQQVNFPRDTIRTKALRFGDWSDVSLALGFFAPDAARTVRSFIR